MTARSRAAVLAIPLLVAVIGCGEQPYRRYESTAAAVAAGERERGWLGGWVPASARDVHLQGDLDSSEWWLKMELSPAAADSLRAVLVPLPADSVRVRRPRNGTGWWFEGLVQQQAANDGALNAHLFRGTGSPVGSGTIVAFDTGSRTVFAWSNGRR